MKLALAEVIIATERLHNMNIMHGDLGLDNTLIDSDGHTMLTDFGQSTPFSDDNENKTAEKREWDRVSIMCQIAFRKQYNKNERDLVEFMSTNMTDSQLPGKYQIANKKLRQCCGIICEFNGFRIEEPSVF